MPLKPPHFLHRSLRLWKREVGLSGHSCQQPRIIFSVKIRSRVIAKILLPITKRHNRPENRGGNCRLLIIWWYVKGLLRFPHPSWGISPGNCSWNCRLKDFVKGCRFLWDSRFGDADDLFNSDGFYRIYEFGTIPGILKSSKFSQFFPLTIDFHRGIF